MEQRRPDVAHRIREDLGNKVCRGQNREKGVINARDRRQLDVAAYRERRYYAFGGTLVQLLETSGPERTKLDGAELVEGSQLIVGRFLPRCKGRSVRCAARGVPDA